MLGPFRQSPRFVSYPECRNIAKIKTKELRPSEQRWWPWPGRRRSSLSTQARCHTLTCIPFNGWPLPSPWTPPPPSSPTSDLEHYIHVMGVDAVQECISLDRVILLLLTRWLWQIKYMMVDRSNAQKEKQELINSQLKQQSSMKRIPVSDAITSLMVIFKITFLNCLFVFRTILQKMKRLIICSKARWWKINRETSQSQSILLEFDPVIINVL